MPAADATRVLQEIGWALAAAHAAGVLHRDVTLANVLVERATGRAMLADFGLAEPTGADQAPQLVGTAEYLAPELLHGAAPTAQSDLYALGVVGWTLCTGHLPITADTPTATLVRRLQQDPVPLAQASPGLPRALRTAIDAALHPDPARRPASVEEWLGMLAGAPPARTLALPLARWVDSGVFARSYYAFALSLAGMLAVMLRSSLPFLLYAILPVWLPLPLVLAGLGLLLGGALHFVMAMVALRRAAAAGYRLTDLRVSLAEALRRRAARGLVPASLLGRVVNDLAWLAGITALLTEIISNSRWAWALFTTSPSIYAVWVVAYDVVQWLWLAWFVGLACGQVIPARPERPRTLRWRLREAFWNSRLGALAFRMASVGLGRHRDAPNTLHRPTEVMLQVGITELCDALPAPQRRALRDVPALADRLQQRIARVRERIALLEATGGNTLPNAAAVRDRLVEHRDEGIAALERLRRDLLRLGTELATTGPLTDQLRHLRHADHQLLRALQSIP